MSVIEHLLNIKLSKVYTRTKEVENLGIFDYEMLEKNKGDIVFYFSLFDKILKNDFEYTLIINTDVGLDFETINNHLKINNPYNFENIDVIGLSYIAYDGYRLDVNKLSLSVASIDAFIISKSCIEKIKSDYLNHDNISHPLLTKKFDNFMSYQIYQSYQSTFGLFPQIFKNNTIFNIEVGKKYIRDFKLYYNKNVNNHQTLDFLFSKTECADISGSNLIKKIIFDGTEIAICYNSRNHTLTNDFFKNLNMLLFKFESMKDCDALVLNKTSFMIKKEACIKLAQNNFDMSIINKKSSMINLFKPMSYTLQNNSICLGDSKLQISKNKITSTNDKTFDFNINKILNYNLVYSPKPSLYLFSFIKSLGENVIVFTDSKYSFLYQGTYFINKDHFYNIFSILSNKQVYLFDLDILLKHHIEDYIFVFIDIDYSVSYEGETFPLENFVKSLIKIIYPSDDLKTGFEKLYSPIKDSKIITYNPLGSKNIKEKTIVSLNTSDFDDLSKLHKKYPKYKIITYSKTIEKLDYVINKKYDLFEILNDISKSKYLTYSERSSDLDFYLKEASCLGTKVI